METRPLLLIYVFPVLLVLALAEALLYRRIRKKPFAWRASLASLLVAVGYQISNLVGFQLTGGAFLWLYQFAPVHYAMDRWYHWLLLFLGLEFFYYWFHRAGHEIRWFWATHSVHHSPEEINLSAAYRLGWTGHITLYPFFFAPLVLLGFSPKDVFTMLSINLLYQFWLHTELIPPLRALELIFNTPSLHRVHHAVNPRYLDTNYGGVLIIFDRLFGTYVAETEPCKFGLITQVNSHNPLRIAFFEWLKIARDLRTARDLRSVLGYLFGPPGWQPDGKGLTTRNLRAAQLPPVSLPQ